MSLAIYLSSPMQLVRCICPTCDYAHTKVDRERLYATNITHNLNAMAKAAGIYHALWRPEEISITKAAQLIPILNSAINNMRHDPSYYRQFDTENGWGTYDQFLPWLQELTDACIEYPDANISVSR